MIVGGLISTQIAENDGDDTTSSCGIIPSLAPTNLTSIATTDKDMKQALMDIISSNGSFVVVNNNISPLQYRAIHWIEHDDPYIQSLLSHYIHLQSAADDFEYDAHEGIMIKDLYGSLGLSKNNH